MATLELSVVGTGAIKAALLAIKPLFKDLCEVSLALSFNTTGIVADRIVRGEVIDVVFTSRESLDELVQQGHVRADSIAEVARSGIGAVVKSGAPYRDISTRQGFEAALVAAQTIAYTNPKSGGASGAAVAHILQRLGIESEVLAKARLGDGGSIAQMVARGEAEFGIHQIPLLIGQPGTDYLGPLPEELQRYTIVAAGIPKTTRFAAGADQLIAFLKSPEAMGSMRALGMN